MKDDVNKKMLESCMAYAEAMEKRILDGEVIADVIYEQDGSRILVTMTEIGKYGYAVFEDGKDTPVYLLEGDKLITDLQKTTDYTGQTLLYPGAKSMIEKNMVGIFAEYRKYREFHDFYISIKASEEATINVTQQMAGYNPQYPVTILGADFIKNNFYYASVAQIYTDSKTGKETVRIGTGGLNPDGTPDFEKTIEMEMKAQQTHRLFGEEPLSREEVTEIIKKYSTQAQSLLFPVYESIGLPTYEGVEYCPMLEQGLKGEPVKHLISNEGNLLTEGKQI